MAGTGNNITQAIITKIGGCLPACGNIITAKFDLICGSIPLQGASDLYSLPMEPGEIQNLFQPVDLYPPDLPYLVPRDKEDEFFKRITVITIDVEHKGQKTTTEYGVNAKKPSQTAVSLTNLDNKTRDKKLVRIENFKKQSTAAKIKVYGITRKNK